MAAVPVNDLSRALSAQREALQAAVGRVLDSGRLVHGPEHRAFEAELAEYLGVRHVVGVGNGTDALEIALRVACGPGRRTIVTAPNCGGYSTVAARSAGLTVRYADVDPRTLLLDASTLSTSLDDTVGAVVVTHLYGRIADVETVRALCEPRGIQVIEDCAQAIGARTTDGAAGSLGDLSTFSFYPTKNLGALGDGGAIVTDDDDLADRLVTARQYGWRGKYCIVDADGRNSRLDEIQAAVLRVRLPHVDAGNARRRAIISRYADAASDAVRVLPADSPAHSGHIAAVETADRTGLIDHLRRHDVGSDIHYPFLDHRQPQFAAEYADITLAVSENAVTRLLSLPCFPELTDTEIEQVCAALASF